ncbi:vitelline membrane outer layer protein 1-like [Tiliqua scincoides]|uniref:vitelline membrane outer layer protein 1-like n=1 Tax=Tiliqua scincoides TaxID=71010 RepID=UPI00346239F8
MALSVSTVLFFILSCGLWVADARPYTSVLTVPNGARWGRWGPAHFCSKGHAVGFQIKALVKGVAPYKSAFTLPPTFVAAANDNDVYYATGNTNGRFGQMSNHCTKGYICGIQTRVQPPQYLSDDTALNDVKMFCCD